MSENRRFVPRGELDPNRDLGVAAGLVLLGAVVPLLVDLLAHDLLALYLPGMAGVAVAAVGVGFCLWLVVEWRDLDRPNVAVAAVLVPAALFAAVPVLGAAGLFAHVPDHLYVSFEAVFGYFGGIALGGLGAVGLSVALERRDSVPDPRRVATGAAVVFVVGLALVAGVNFAAASSATVTSMEAGLAPVSDPALNVTVEGASAEMRVTVVGPTGASVTERVSRDDLEDGRTTVSARLWNDETPPDGYLAKANGTYRVRVTTLAGVTVDRATFEADPGVALRVVETDSARGELDWNRSDPGSQHEVRVGVAVTNDGAFHTSAEASVAVPGEARDPRSGTYYFAPGETEAVVVGIPEEAVERLRDEGSETVTVTVWQSRHRDRLLVTVEVPLPDEESDPGPRP
jgi:hypothetical protein